MSRPATGIVAWMARNHVAANLIMLALLIGGGVTTLNIRQEVFPSFQLDVVDIGVSYPGASPEEVENGLLLPIEEALRGLEVVERVVATAEEGRASVEVELVDGADANRALQDVSAAVNRISFFPEDAERPTVGLRLESRDVLRLVVYGPLEERDIHDLAERIRRDLVALPAVSQVDIPYGRPPEIRLEIPSATLRSLGLALGDVAGVIRNSARDLPAGGVSTPGGEYLLRTSERREVASAYADIPVVSTPEGATIRLGDVAVIRDAFEDRAYENWFNGGRGLFISISQTGEEKPLDIAAAVHGYLDELRATLPQGVHVDVMRDRAAEYQSRLDLLLGNGIIGLLLVLGTLGLFLQPRLAFWVAAGVPTTLIGALLLLPALGSSVNMISLFAFIVTLGIVVDDAVIVGENIFHEMEQGKPRLQAAVDGARQMTVPILFAVATNIIAFLPLLFVPGETGRFFSPLPAVVIAVFLVSLVEALFVLPAHLAHGGDGPLARLLAPVLDPIGRVQRACSRGFDGAVDAVFMPSLRAALRHRYPALAVLMAAVALSWAWYASGRIRYTFNPVISGARVDAEVQTPSGAPFQDTVRIAKHVEAAGLRAAERVGGGDPEAVLRGRMNVVGRKGENWADVNFILVPDDQRDFDQATFVQAWREEIGEVAGMDSLYFEWEEGPGSGSGLTVELTHPDRRVLEEGAAALAARMAQYRGVTDIKDGFAAGKPQIDVQLTPFGRALGLTPEVLGRQVRHAFYGAEALRLQRGRHELKVMVRLPEGERRTLAAVEDLPVRLPGGGEALLGQLAALRFGRAFTQIDRVDGRRVLNVTANTIPELANINAVRAALEAEVLPQLVADHPGLEYRFSGRQREERRAMSELSAGLALALLVIFALLAALYRSYLQAIVTMGIIPLALAAALWGHVLLGHDLSVVSLFGMIALCGLVVNGGLVLNTEINACLAAGDDIVAAACRAARRRFRPVVLTSLTTFAGLAPMILETDPQALFLVPMAIALGFGTLVSGVVLLIALPAARVVLADAARLVPRRAAAGEVDARDATPASAAGP